MSKVYVCIPWIETNCVWRERAREWTFLYWQRLGVDVAYGISDARPVNRSQARNLAAHAAGDSDVLFFCDSDMWVGEEQFHAAVELAASSGRMVLAYTDHLRLNKWSTEKVLDGEQPTYQGQTIKGCSGGCFAVTRELYETVGGHDERFMAWGYEDRCFMFACDTIAGPGQRIPGISHHCWHPRSADQSRTTEDRKKARALAIRYKNAAGVKGRSGVLPATRDAVADPAAMLELMQEPGGPLHRAFREPLFGSSSRVMT